MSREPHRFDVASGHFGGRGMTRRGLIAAAFLTAVGSVSGGARARDASDIAFGLTPVFLSNDLLLLEQLHGYLERATGTAVNLVTRRTYQEITALLLAGQLDAAWICGYPFVRYRDRLAIVAVPVWNGRALYQSYLVVGAARAADGIHDLEGDIHAFSDPDSNSGHLVTQALLVDMGTTPDRFFQRAFFTYGHRNVIRAVASGLAGSGSVDGYVWEVMREVEPDLVSQTRVLQRSDWLGFPPIACPASAANSPKTRLIADALLNMAGDAGGRKVLEMLRLDGFGERPPGDFGGIAELYRKVRAVG